ncbi:MAG: Alpha-N-arabinofuranosidase [Candidatus Solibacter sp.]|nr:Alpha-N-arabinofuranosidase [Candidatus Solibacter sp.]
MTTRRGFLLGAGAAGAAILTTRRGLSSPATDQKVSIDLGKETGTIRPELHGHFAEHLGSCVYGGLWVGKTSKIPNINGHRKQAVEYLRGLVPVLRWPGGCFADDYHWRDGIGPAAKRPKGVNITWGMYTEDNSFGTHEFMELCRLLDAQPYLAGNVGSGTPEELRNWMEYCNYPKGSSLSDERAANGSPGPFNVKYWGVGNENWGCGGNMSGDEYATQYRRFANYLRPFGGTAPFLIACGPNGNDKVWTEKFWKNMRGNRPSGFAMHFYSNGRRNTATHFTVDNMREQLASFPSIEAAIIEQRALIDTLAPPNQRGPVGLLLDEWGVWDQMDPAEDKKYGRLFQQITMRGAVAAALGLNIAHRQAGKLVMTNIAQMVNVLHALLLTEEDKCVRTTTYYVYDFMKAHLGQMSVETETGAPGAMELSMSASRKEKDLTITLVNPKPDATVNVTCSIAGGTTGGATGRILQDNDLNAANTFTDPNHVTPKVLKVTSQGSMVAVELPPLSVATIQVRLA